MNTLYYGDNLHILREHIADESVDLIYLDRLSTRSASITSISKRQKDILLKHK